MDPKVVLQLVESLHVLLNDVARSPQTVALLQPFQPFLCVLEFRFGQKISARDSVFDLRQNFLSLGHHHFAGHRRRRRAVVGNKIRGPKDQEFLEAHLSDFDFLGFLPYDDALIEADLNGVSPFDVDSSSREQIREMIAKL